MRRDREHEEQHEHEQRRGSEHAERGQVAVAAAREAAAAALDAHRLFTERDLVCFIEPLRTRQPPTRRSAPRWRVLDISWALILIA